MRFVIKIERKLSLIYQNFRTNMILLCTFNQLNIGQIYKNNAKAKNWG